MKHKWTHSACEATQRIHLREGRFMPSLCLDGDGSPESMLLCKLTAVQLASPAKDCH